MPSEAPKHCKIQRRRDAPKMAILEAPCAQNAPGRSTMRPPEALLPRNPTWESPHFSGLTTRLNQFDSSVAVLGKFREDAQLPETWAMLPFQRMPWGGGKKRGVENLTNDTPPKKGFWTPPRTLRFPPPSGVSALFSCTKMHDRADQKLFWRGPKIFGRARSLVRFPPPIRFAPPPQCHGPTFGDRYDWTTRGTVRWK